MSESEKRPKRLSRKERERREFMRTSAMVVGVTGFSLLTLLPTVSNTAPRLRPPGALDEKEYLASCIKCGQCVQVCPVEAIELADIFDGQGQACPTGALTHEINYSHETRMGIARLELPDECLAMKKEGFRGITRGPEYNGKLRFDEIDRWEPQQLNEQHFDLPLCDLCVRLCPIEIRANQCDAGKPPSGDKNQCPPHRAIMLSVEKKPDGGLRYRPTVLEGCVGCGVCEMVCPTAAPSIVIDERKVWEDVA